MVVVLHFVLQDVLEADLLLDDELGLLLLTLTGRWHLSWLCLFSQVLLMDDSLG